MSTLNIPSTVEDPAYRYKMPRIQTKVEGRGNGIKTAFMNAPEVANAIKTQPDFLVKYFGYELGSQATYTEKENQGIQAQVMGKHDQADIQKLVDDFLYLMILCPRCKLPELNHAFNAKKGSIGANCRACGFNGNLTNLEAHKLGKYILNSAKDKDAAGKKTKQQRAEERRLKAQAGNKDDDDSDDESEEEVKKPKKEKKDKKEKKEKKDKKEKKEKKAKKKDSSSDMSVDGDAKEVPESKANSPADAPHREGPVQEVILELRELVQKETGVDNFVEEAKMAGITNKLSQKLKVYVAVEALFGDENGVPLNSANFTAKKEYLKGMCKLVKLSCKDLMWSFETYCVEHPAALKGFPMVVKGMYDEDLFEDEDFIEHYTEEECTHPGYSDVKKVVQPFIAWLKESDDDDSGSD